MARQRCCGKRAKREACPSCEKKTLSHYKPYVYPNGKIIPSEDICRSCHKIFRTINGIMTETTRRVLQGGK